MTEPGSPFNDPEHSEYPVAVRAYLAMETALAKRILEDRTRANAFANTPNNWPAGQSWDDLGQTSHEGLWQAARREAGIPSDSAFKNDVLLRGSCPPAPSPEAIEAVRCDEAVRDAFVECYTLHSIVSEEGNTPEWLPRWERVESRLIRNILARGVGSPQPAPDAIAQLPADWRAQARDRRDKADMLLSNRAGTVERESLLGRARAYETCAEELQFALGVRGASPQPPREETT